MLCPACPASCRCRLRWLPALLAYPAWCWCLDAQRAVARLHDTYEMRATRADELVLAGAVETPKYMSDHQDKYIANRPYFRVLLAEPMPRRLATTWLVPLSHIKTGNRDGLSFLRSNPLNQKVRLMAALQNHFWSGFPALHVRKAARTAGAEGGEREGSGRGKTSGFGLGCQGPAPAAAPAPAAGASTPCAHPAAAAETESHAVAEAET